MQENGSPFSALQLLLCFLMFYVLWNYVHVLVSIFNFRWLASIALLSHALVCFNSQIFLCSSISEWRFSFDFPNVAFSTTTRFGWQLAYWLAGDDGRCNSMQFVELTKKAASEHQSPRSSSTCYEMRRLNNTYCCGRHQIVVLHSSCRDPQHCYGYDFSFFKKMNNHYDFLCEAVGTVDPRNSMNEGSVIWCRGYPRQK